MVCHCADDQELRRISIGKAWIGYDAFVVVCSWVSADIQISMCEIDKQVVDVAKEYLGNITATSYDDPRLDLVRYLR